MADKSHPPSYKTDFLQSCLSAEVLTFGDYTLKSGRRSPYFFNAGLFHRADLLRSISTAYARSILDFIAHTPLSIDVLFGPSYKGIPLATATVDKLAELDPDRFARVSYSFNRKEAKDHGEGGNIVGASLRGKRVLIVDDVITAGTAMREAIDIIRREGGELVGVIVALDRMEKMPGGPDDDDGSPRLSAIGEVKRVYGVPVLSIVTLDDLIGLLRGMGGEKDMERLEEYKARYRASG
ncbi:orotate phosphoribosyltransferase [Pseudocyphellaria aurata]|nr:orotate phosphoribosyltransferase [Pseudocyphellaria aurata]